MSYPLHVFIFYFYILKMGSSSLVYYFKFYDGYRSVVLGQKFGKHKLWPKVSPKKTWEGLIGGIITSVILTSVYWYFFIGKVSPSLVILFSILAGCSQVGDLVQSKMKRQFDIKDSSSLIPGHGGVYDRIDSLLFVAPLFALVLMKFYPYSLQ